MLDSGWATGGVLVLVVVFRLRCRLEKGVECDALVWML